MLEDPEEVVVEVEVEETSNREVVEVEVEVEATSNREVFEVEVVETSNREVVEVEETSKQYQQVWHPQLRTCRPSCQHSMARSHHSCSGR